MARAGVYFEAQHWERAARDLRSVAIGWGVGTDEGAHAAGLYLEALNELGMHAVPARVACLEQMTEDGLKLLGL